MDLRKFRPSTSDKNLIAEQPGMTVVLIGLAVAFLIGYVTRSALSPTRISARLEKAARNIHKDVKVTFEAAHFSLSDGVLPRMAVVISNVRMESENICWAAPVLEVDELRLPVSFFALIRGQEAVRYLQANNMNLRLRKDFKNCDEVAEKKALQPVPVKLTPNQSAQRYKNDISGISIQKFEISSDKFPEYSLEFLNFAVNVKSFEPRVLEVTAKSHMFRDSLVGDYPSHANIYIQYKEVPEQVVQAHFFGNWREGHYSVIGNYTIGENMLAVEADLKHIPISQILGILQKYKMASADLIARQVWVSAKGRSVSPIDRMHSAPIEIRDLRLEGDLGEMRVDQIDIKSLKPLVYLPILIDIKKLDIEKLLQLLNRPKKTNILGALGHFSGRGEIISDRKMKMTGEHTGLEFVFSNKGQQELQVIDSMVGDVALSEDSWDFSISRLKPRAGFFLGNVKMKADRDFSAVDVKTRVEEVLLAPSVQHLMTNGGNIGVLSLDADVQLKNSQLSFLKGLLRVDTMNIEGMLFAKTKSTFDWSQGLENGEIILNTHIQSLEVSNISAASAILREVTPTTWWSDKGMRLNSLNSELRSRTFDIFSWRNVQARVGKEGKLFTEGSWNAAGDLTGRVQAREGKIQTRWDISGTRVTPIFKVDVSGERK